MANKSLLFWFVLMFSTVAANASAAENVDGIYAEILTTKGMLRARLFYEQAPITVANFIGLSNGLRKWKDPLAGDEKQTPFFDNLRFHRVIPGLMIQSGDPKGTGRGGPGYILEHEFHPALRHSGPGVLSMLNQDQFAHGSQFFITLKPAPFLDNRHSVFGEVVDGLHVLHELNEKDRIIRVTIRYGGQAALEFPLKKYLEKLDESAHVADYREKSSPEQTALSSVRRENDLPELDRPVDPARIPQKNQPRSGEIALQYILVNYKGAFSSLDAPEFTREQALKRANHLAMAARLVDADFEELAVRYSDSPEYALAALHYSEDCPAGLEPIFLLKEGQVSDPVDTVKGYMVFKRVELERIRVRHIMISYEGAEGMTVGRSRSQALQLARRVLDKIRNGEEFEFLAREYSDSATAENGGLIGEITRGVALPAFETAAFSLEVNQVSDITPTPSGFQIIKREK